ncbi:hypothetical protein Avbf_15277 [Armadillidium vulgare]|nr:hypothetical protein Avbf_15277 [Armadillidium vulgare]
MSCSSNTTFQGKEILQEIGPNGCIVQKEFICGLRTKVEDSFTADKVGLVAVTMRCCHVGETVAWDYDYDYHSDNNSTDSNTYEDTFNQIGTNIKNFGSTVKNFTSEGASEVENAFDDAKNAFNNAKKDIEDRFKNENSSLPSTEDTNKTAEEIKFPPH